MDDEISNSLPLILGGPLLLCTGILGAIAVAIEEEEYLSQLQVAAEVIASSLMEGHQKRSSHGGGGGRNTRRYIHWDRERAVTCINRDYLGSIRSFGLDDFKRIFRVSRTSYDSIRNFLCENAPFFADGFDVTHRQWVSSDAKILISLKYLAYGCSINSFRDYFQVGESTAMQSVKELTKSISNSIFQKKFFSFFTPSDARKVEALHYDKHGIHGMLGSLDCSHFMWGNCPVAHHGQFQGKEGKPTIVVEALADHNFFVWYAVFGYCGTLNDITIWDSSYLLQSLCDGSFSDLDFTFNIGGEEFDHLWMLVDGIYPSLARFVKPVSVPLGDTEALFSLWQESKRKDIERFFGVFKKKFNFFNRPLPFAYMDDIISCFYCCIILHNIAITERLDDELEGSAAAEFNDCVVDSRVHGMAEESRIERLAMQFVQREAEHVGQHGLELSYLTALGINVLDNTLLNDTNQIEVLSTLERIALYRWNHLYDVRCHKKLTEGIAGDLCWITHY